MRTLIATQSAQSRGTLLGITALLLWSTVPSLIRLLTETFGPLCGAALMYTTATGLLGMLLGWPSLKSFPRRYLLVGGGLFVAYEMALSLSLGYAQSRTQAIELVLLNYLWPCMTVALAVLLRQQRGSLLLIPGLALSLVGVAWIMSGGKGIALDHLLANALQNPVGYGLALSCALTWACYCCVAKRLARGTDAIVPFFAMVSVVLWIKFAVSDEPLVLPTFHNAGLVAGAAAALALGYAAWNRALEHGNLLMLAAVSYTTPVLSSVCSSVILSTTLKLSFWQGAVLVTAGSLVCWWATRSRQRD